MEAIIRVLLLYILIFIFARKSLVFSETIFKEIKASGGKRIAVCLIGSLLCEVGILFLPGEAAIVSLYVTMFLAYNLLWHGQKPSVLFLVNAYILNIIVINTLVFSILLFAGQWTDWSSKGKFFTWHCAVVATTALILILSFAQKKLPMKKIRLIADHPSFRRGMNGWMGTSNLFLLLHRYLFSEELLKNPWLIVDNIVICILFWCANWGFLFYNMRLIKMMGYEKEMKRLSRKASHDGLTGLLNKVTAMTLIDEIIIEGGALFVVDIDDFKVVNDSLGHAEGDLLIRKIAGELRTVFREDDIVGRFGGDEFVVFMRNSSISKELIKQRAKMLCHKCNELVKTEKDKLSYSVSVGGLLVKPGRFQTFQDGFELADRAMYMAKKSGKNTYKII
ncbi:MAG: GGDEF domain-containing protein [Lachnospiraceae bacterium]|nr:GGDEF domain-containing protein [Lachnospiraceae bacterium]